MSDGFPRNFKASEFNCKCNKCAAESPAPESTRHLAWVLQLVRDEIGVPIRINSGYRCPDHNKAIGGHPNSYHMKGWAADLHPVGKTPRELHGAIEALVSTGTIPEGGMGLYNTFVHYDIQHRRRRWNG